MVKNEKISQALSNLMKSRTVSFQSAYARISGGAVNGLVLSQAIYLETRHDQKKTKLTDKDGQVREYFWHSHEQWFEDLGVSRREINGARATLKEKGFIHEIRAQVPARLFYRVDIDKVVEALSDLKDKEEVSNQESPKRSVQSEQNGLSGEPETGELDSPKRSIIREDLKENIESIGEDRLSANAESAHTSEEVLKRTDISDGKAPANKNVGKSKRSGDRSALKSDWDLDDELLGWTIATAWWINVQTELENFRDHHIAKGSKMADWRAAWRNWVRNFVKWTPEPAQPSTQPQNVAPAAPNAQQPAYAGQVTPTTNRLTGKAVK